MATPKTKPTNETELQSGVGASDGTNGGGAGSGTPDAETGTRAGDAVNKGNRADDRKKLFPDSTGEASQAGRSDVSNEDTE
jgi:hypothetical protein